MANVQTASADADHSGADDRKSVSGWVVMLNSAMVSWASKRQPVTAIGSTEPEIYSVSQCEMECLCLRRVMELLGYRQPGPPLRRLHLELKSPYDLLTLAAAFVEARMWLHLEDTWM